LAFTQAAMLLANDTTFTRSPTACSIAALWWSWMFYASLTNILNLRMNWVGAALLAALVAAFVAALVVHGVFEDEGAMFGAAFLVVCATQIALCAFTAHEN
jgi:low temperature requirement protein LtrA